MEFENRFDRWQTIFGGEKSQILVSAERLNEPSCPTEHFYYLYAKALHFYHLGDTQALRDIGSEFSRYSDLSEEWQMIMTCFQIRLWIREGLLGKAELAPVESFSKSRHIYWVGELNILMGHVYSVLQEHTKSLRHFLLAKKSFFECKDMKRFHFAEFNALATQSIVEPERNRIPLYHSLARRALLAESKDLCVAGLCYLNMSREMQLLGSYFAALTFANRSIKHLESEFGSRNHMYALAQRADVWFSLNRQMEANIDLEICAKSNFQDVQNIAILLARKLKKESISEKRHEGGTNPAWEGRESEFSRKAFTRQEEALVKYLASGLKTRSQILKFMFDDRIDFESSVSRLHNLMARVRKKFPDLICSSSEGYFLADVFVPLFKNTGDPG